MGDGRGGRAPHSDPPAHRPHAGRRRELLDGILYVTGQLPEGFEPFEISIRLEF
jgi:hypothetical protein